MLEEKESKTRREEIYILTQKTKETTTSQENVLWNKKKCLSAFQNGEKLTISDFNNALEETAQEDTGKRKKE